MTMIQVYDPRIDKGFAFNWGVIAKDKLKWRRLFHHPNARWVLHNTKHDRKMLKQWLRVDLGDRDIDTYAYALGLTEKGNQTGLKYLSRQYCNAPYYEEGLDYWLSTDKDKINYGHIRPDVLAQYGCYDVFFTYGLKEVLPALVEREGTTWLVENILLPAQRTFAEVEGTGILIDQPYMAALQEGMGTTYRCGHCRGPGLRDSCGFPVQRRDREEPGHPTHLRLRSVRASREAGSMGQRQEACVGLYSKVSP
jgi:DNA polymerase I-like protein with 3'-5' exonuclease and polymerase domains